MSTRAFRTWCAIVIIALLFGGCQDSCQQKPTTSIADTQLTQPGGFLVELAAAAIPPGSAKCTNGTAIISSWQNLFSLDLTNQVAQDITSKLPTPTAESTPGELYQIGGDPQMARLKDGSVVLLRQGTTTAPFKDKTPEWSSYNNGQRGYLFIWRTQDCGNSWEVYHPIDIQNFLGGICAWPQVFKDDNGNPYPGFGGFDRSELYADPWNGNLYLTTSCRGGTEPKYSDHFFQQNLLFTLRPTDTDWHGPVSITGDALLPTVLPWDPPLVMTSTKSGTLWLYHCDESQPQPQGRLYISEDQGGSIVSTSGTQVVFDDTNPSDAINQCLGVGSDKLANNQTVLTQDYSLSHSGDSQVRLAFPRVENGRQVLQVAIITKTTEKITVRPIQVFKAEATDASIIQHSFVETDRVDLNEESNGAALYWLESSPGSGQIQVRYSLVKSNLDWSDPKAASAAPWTANIGGWGGDYVNGAFYFEKGEPHFLLVWPQSEASISDPNMNLHYAVVTSKL